MTNPPDLEQLMGRAGALARSGELESAVAAYDEILRKAPRHAGALTSRGSALLTLKRPDAAEASFREAYAALPHHPVTLWNLGNLLVETGRPEQAQALAEAAIGAGKDHARAFLLRADALCGQGKFRESLAEYERAQTAEDLAYDALGKRGVALGSAGDPGQALATLAQAIALRPDDPTAFFFRALVRLPLRDFAAWADYERRWDLKGFIEKSGGIVSPALAPQLSRGASAESLRGQRLLLIAEQGIGDQVMFASMIPDLAGVARAVTMISDQRLVRLFQASFPWITVAGPATARVGPQDVDRLVALGSLGAAFRPTEEAFPGTPYLVCPPQVRDGWRCALGPRQAPLRIGLSWLGGGASTRRQHRSVPLAMLRPLLELPGCEFVSLQYGDCRAELDAVNATLSRPIRVFDPTAIEDFEDLAGLVMALDRVISVQTAVVHLAGALGQTCLVLVPHSPEWRYGIEGPTMPWYRSVRIFRQAGAGEWWPVLAAVKAAVEQRLADPGAQPS